MSAGFDGRPADHQDESAREASPRPVAVLVSALTPDADGTGAEQRAWAWLAELAATYEVVLVAPMRAGTGVSAYARAVDLAGVARYTGGWRRWAGFAAPPLALLAPAFRDDWWVPRRGAAGSAELGAVLGLRERPALVVSFRANVDAVARAVVRAVGADRTVLDLDDREGRTRWAVAVASLRVGNPRRATRELGSAAQHTLTERALVAQYDEVTLAARSDVARFAGRHARALHRPNLAVRRDPLPPLDASRAAEPLRLLFVGHLGYPPNEFSVRWIARRLVPALRSSGLAWRIDVVGRQPSERVQRLVARTPGMHLHPDVPQVRPWYEQCDVVLAPVFHGGGTKVKVVEAVALGRPVIASRHAVRDLPPTDLVQVAQRPHEVLAALEGRGRRTAGDLTARARETYERAGLC